MKLNKYYNNTYCSGAKEIARRARQIYNNKLRPVYSHEGVPGSHIVLQPVTPEPERDEARSEP